MVFSAVPKGIPTKGLVLPKYFPNFPAGGWTMAGRADNRDPYRDP